MIDVECNKLYTRIFVRMYTILDERIVAIWHFCCGLPVNKVVNIYTYTGAIKNRVMWSFRARISEAMLLSGKYYVHNYTYTLRT